MSTVIPSINNLGIDKLKDVVNNEINVDGKTIQAVVNPEQMNGMNIIALFYDNEGGLAKLANISNSGFFHQGILIACRHNDYRKSRLIAIEVLKLIGRNKKAKTGFYFDTRESNIDYLGLDESDSAYVWGFNLVMKGAL